MNIWRLLQQIPPGKVSTYGAIGNKLGIHPRQVGRLLHQNSNPAKYPCHRVVKGDGSIASGYAFGGREGQIAKLKAEGIKIRSGKIVNFKNDIYILND